MNRHANQTKTAEGDNRWRVKVSKERYHLTVHRIDGFRIKSVATCEIKLEKNQRLSVQVNDSTLKWRKVLLEIKGSEYKVEEKPQ